MAMNAVSSNIKYEQIFFLFSSLSLNVRFSVFKLLMANCHSCFARFEPLYGYFQRCEDDQCQSGDFKNFNSQSLFQIEMRMKCLFDIYVKFR